MRYFESEREFTQWALVKAREYGWQAWHFGNSTKIVRTKGGGYKPVPDKDASGFPDVVLCHPEHGLLFAELKFGDGKPSPAQLVALRALRAAGARVYVWRDVDQDEIVDVLQTGKTTLRLWQEAVA